MSNIIFSERVKYLRSSHLLSQIQLADIWDRKNKSTVSEIESGRNSTTLEGLTSLADLFAVSLDWLAGRTETPYVSEVIEYLEIETLPCKEYLIGANVLTREDFKDTRKLTLEQRANVIFALHVLKYFASAKFSSKRARTSFVKVYNQCLDFIKNPIIK